MKPIAIATILIIAFGGCMSSFTPQDQPETTGLIIRTGTSAGMCVGYCAYDYVFNGSSVTLTQSGNRTQSTVSPKSCQSTISQDDWNTLQSAANLDAFSKQPTVIGCPDCTDAGAEYVELELGDKKHRVTFPFAQTIPGFESLLKALRSQRAAFKECQ
ncbi:hypothetical protein GCM10028805_12050 [Spirosoma harenae]